MIFSPPKYNAIVITADDYGYYDAVSRGILDLIEHKVITATSCLVNSPNWQDAVRQVMPQHRQQADFGLHLDFTEFGLYKKRLPQLIAQSYTRLLNKHAIKHSIQQQLDTFENGLNTMPDYIDGHQHIHQLPQIREALINELNRRYSDIKPWVRVSRVADLQQATSKEKLISALGANTLSTLAAQTGLRTNQSLIGVYDFDTDMAGYQQNIQRWLQQPLTQPAALMIHPARDDAPAHDPHDPIANARTLEYRFFRSAEFTSLLQKNGLRIERFSACFNAGESRV